MDTGSSKSKPDGEKRQHYIVDEREKTCFHWLTLAYVNKNGRSPGLLGICRGA